MDILRIMSAGAYKYSESVYACLDRMQCDCIDLLYFHFYDPGTPVERGLSVIEDLVRQDVIRYFGVSISQ